eukprot:gene9662-8621_t
MAIWPERAWPSHLPWLHPLNLPPPSTYSTSEAQYLQSAVTVG